MATDTKGWTLLIKVWIMHLCISKFSRFEGLLAPYLNCRHLLEWLGI